MVEKKEKLFQEFPPVPAQVWTDKIISDLQGASFEKKLVWKTGEGVDVKPFYTIDDLEKIMTTTSLPGDFPYIRGTKTNNTWLIRQDLRIDNCKVANEKVRRLINDGGVTSLGFHFQKSSVNANNIAWLLEGINPEKTELNFTVCKSKVVELIGLLVNYFRSIQANLYECKGSITYNPFKKPLVHGVINNSWIDEATSVITAGEALPNYRVLTVDAYYFNDAGSSITQESGYALAWGNELIFRLSKVGLPVEKIAKKIKFNFGITSNYFLEIAKFRAVRRLWAEIVKAYHPVCNCPEGCCGDDYCEDRICFCSCKISVHARTSAWNMTVYDAYVNLLRTQTESMSAALAGVDSITVLPYDYAYKMPEEFSERIARNQQLLLKDECHLDKVVDPSAGSYYIESLTQSFVDAAWKLFLEVEDKGGFTIMVNNGDIQRAVNETNKSRNDKIATRCQVLLGVNQYPNFSERVGEKVSHFGVNGDCGCGSGPIAKLDFSRGAAAFETLRLSTEKRGKTMKVFMLTIGDPAMRLARSQFSANFFGCAGYEIIKNLGFDSVAEGVQAALDKDADIIVLCSSDEGYITYGPEVHRLVGDKALLIVAGAPANIDELKAQGMTHFISMKSNVLETLQEINLLIEKKISREGLNMGREAI